MPALRFSGVIVAMLAAMALVGAVAAWDGAREADEGLEDFGQQQAMMAKAAASVLGAQLSLDAAERSRALHELARFEIPGMVRVAVRPPGGALQTPDGRSVDDPALGSAMDSGLATLRLTREQAARLGLPQRTAVAGIAHLSVGAASHWSIATIASALRERDRDRRAQWRLLLSVALAGAAVLGLGSFMLRQQRKQLELSHTLEVSKLARQADERLERLGKMATLVTLASGVAHEVSTPLGVIVGRAEQLLPRVKDDERATKAVQVVLDQADRISQTIRGFLTLAREGTPALERVSAAAVVRGALELVEHRLAQAGVQVQNGVSEDLPQFPGDRRLLEHALVNLLLNACDARSGRVEVAARATAADLAIEVTDDGVGITAADAVRATEPFFTTKPVGEGTGLGLAIANEIVKSHRGTLEIGPSPGRGTRVSLRIPLAEGAGVAP